MPVKWVVALVRLISLDSRFSAACKVSHGEEAQCFGGASKGSTLPPPSSVPRIYLQQLLLLFRGDNNSPYFIELLRVKRVNMYEEFRIVAGI